MIFPGASTQGQAEAQFRPGRDVELVPLETRSGQKIVAMYGAALNTDGSRDPAPADRPTLIFFYGNAMCLKSSATDLNRFRRLGLNVLIPEYVGYGMSDGRASETGCRETAEAAYRYLLRTRDVAPQHIIAAGWSLGGAVAIDLASRETVGALIAFSTFTSTRDMATTIFPLSPPRWFFVHRFESLSKLPNISCPILLGHGRFDPLVPLWMFERLVESNRAAITSFVIDDAGHNDFFDVGGRRIDKSVSKFVADNFRSEP
jgi:pimeloyl-ACP methyl ester carboxylesterase